MNEQTLARANELKSKIDACNRFLEIYDKRKHLIFIGFKGSESGLIPIEYPLPSKCITDLVSSVIAVRAVAEEEFRKL